MKLYATVASERATKGQGGKNLTIRVLNEDKQEIVRVYADSNGNTNTIEVWEMNQVVFSKRYATKGEKKRGECTLHHIHRGVDCN